MIEIIKTTDKFDGTTIYTFIVIDEYGDSTKAGEAIHNGEGYIGDFDTRALDFDNDDELVAILKRRYPNDEIVIA